MIMLIIKVREKSESMKIKDIFFVPVMESDLPERPTEEGVGRKRRAPPGEDKARRLRDER